MSFICTNMITVLLLVVCALFSKVDSQQSDENDVNQKQQAQLNGAWKLASGATQLVDVPKGATAITMMEDGYFTVAYFNEAEKKFIGTYGGTFIMANGKLTQTFEYNTLDTATVGTANTLTYTLKDGQLQVAATDKGKTIKQTWTKIENSNPSSPLEGTWRITGRAGEDGTINPMQRGPRKTLKILSDNRFQWIAFNTETKQFSGTGGGTYTAENGKYTENIEFFSRDSSRVGASLSFNFEVKDGKWHHTGQSSTGKPVNEVWERE